jgi:hypothetical protein
VGEAYSTIKGLFKQYELFYVVADERDVIRLRTNVRRDPPEDVYYLPAQGTLGERAGACSSITLKKIDSLASHPEFYNTVTPLHGQHLAAQQGQSGQRAVFREDPAQRLRSRIPLMSKANSIPRLSVSRAAAAKPCECRRAGGRPGEWNFSQADPRAACRNENERMSHSSIAAIAQERQPLVERRPNCRAPLVSNHQARMLDVRIDERGSVRAPAPR